MPKVRRVIISWRFNCLAEALLAQLRPAPTWVFHVDKTDEQRRAFECPRWVEQSVYSEQEHHSGMLQRILVDREWPKLLDADALVFMDHDFVMRPGFNFRETIGQRLVSGVIAGHPISAPAFACDNPMACYTTIPAFAVNPRHECWPHPWWGCFLDGVYWDTGQRIGFAMRNQIDVFDQPCHDAIFHWGSWYVYLDDPARRQEADAARAHYVEMAKTGLWSVGSSDMNRVHIHPVLEDAFRIMYRGY